MDVTGFWIRMKSSISSLMSSAVHTNGTVCTFPSGLSSRNAPSLSSQPTGVQWARRASRRSTRRNSRSTSRRSEEHTSELQSRLHLVCRLLLEKKKKKEKDRIDGQHEEDNTEESQKYDSTCAS